MLTAFSINSLDCVSCYIIAATLNFLHCLSEINCFHSLYLKKKGEKTTMETLGAISIV